MAYFSHCLIIHFFSVLFIFFAIWYASTLVSFHFLKSEASSCHCWKNCGRNSLPSTSRKNHSNIKIDDGMSNEISLYLRIVDEQKVLSVEKSSKSTWTQKIQFEDEIGLILIFIIIAPHRLSIVYLTKSRISFWNWTREAAKVVDVLIEKAFHHKREIAYKNFFMRVIQKTFDNMTINNR